MLLQRFMYTCELSHYSENLSSIVPKPLKGFAAR